MHLSLSTVHRMEQRPVVKSIKRRELLVSLLGIPAAQLGLEVSSQSVKSPLKPNNDLMALMEDTVQTKWAAYRMGGPHAAASGMNILLQQLITLAKETQGTPWHERRGVSVHGSFDWFTTHNFAHNETLYDAFSLTP